MWKWGSRIQGGGLLWLALGLLIDAFGAAFMLFLFSIVVAGAMTFRVGLRQSPTGPVYTSPPGGGLMGLGFKLQDKLGDLFLTYVWNMVRDSTDYRV